MNHNDYGSIIAELSAPMPKVGVMRPFNFHKVLKNSVTFPC